MWTLCSQAQAALKKCAYVANGFPLRPQRMHGCDIPPSSSSFLLFIRPFPQDLALAPLLDVLLAYLTV